MTHNAEDSPSEVCVTFQVGVVLLVSRVEWVVGFQGQDSDRHELLKQSEWMCQASL